MALGKVGGITENFFRGGQPPQKRSKTTRLHKKNIPLYFCSQRLLVKSCSYKYWHFSFFLLDLKAAFTELGHIRVHEFLFPLLRASFECFFTKIKLHVSNICDLFSRIRYTENENLIRAKK